MAQKCSITIPLTFMSNYVRLIQSLEDILVVGIILHNYYLLEIKQIKKLLQFLSLSISFKIGPNCIRQTDFISPLKKWSHELSKEQLW